ncbi:rho GTPase-activating protein 12-like isoform X2 [Syngnathoides biaculeatus]|uniref:rho GTPase-activating protein 12-like isoform X2 n=1 Tax=Syngnathoides biaculeatus TaxID=300417 RepID=UPI002ADE4EB2|nr:rho GTPase-activating protein 12-like isoform X2 [Syngnathoides biaculeatus]
MAELPIAPGQVYIEVEYDYEYTSKDRLVAIHQGECYMLVQKTNEDWWKVRKEEGSKAFYVPAQYVREVRKALMPPPKPLPHHSVSAGNTPLHLPVSTQTTPPHNPVSTRNTPPQNTNAVWVKPANMDQALQDSSTESLDRPESTPARSPSVHSSSSLHLSPPIHRRDSNHHRQHYVPGTPTGPERSLAEILSQSTGPLPSQRSSTLPRARAQSPELFRAPLDVDSPSHSGEEQHTNDSESGDELSSSSTEQLQSVSSLGQGRRDTPVYSNLQELKINQSAEPPLPAGAPHQVLGDWETYKDQHGRLFYYNRCSQERTWKPPRARDASESRGGHANAGESFESTTLSLSPSFFPFLSLSLGRLRPLWSEEGCFSSYSSLSESQYGSPPRGWSEGMDQAGHTLYVSNYTNEKWLKHVDEQGRPYYYSADGSRSEWELPKYNHSPPQHLTDPTKTRSLDRKVVDPIVLTKWRHSTFIQEPNDKPSEKCGVLNVTKITENGKKVRKNWTSSWTVLQGSTLLFTKGQGGGTSWFGASQSKPELTVDLKGGSVDWASKDKSSKKHVIELKTRQGTELLIQSENDVIINEWYRALKDTVSSPACESDEAIEDDLSDSAEAEKQDREKERRDSKKGRPIKTSSSVEGADNKKTKHKLKKFLTRRPTLQAVRDKGYIKDQVFGASLATLCQRENDTVPSFVKMCMEHVESNALHIGGLYRVSGNLALIQKLRYAVNHDEKVSLADSKWEDIHVTTGALKMFFRELPEPLFTYTLFHDFVSSIKIPDYRQRVNAIKELVRQLPEPNHDTMQALFKHLRKVIEHGEENRMTNQSIAIVFGPTLLRPETEMWNMAVHMVYQNQIVELILLEYDNLFGR